MVGMVTEQPLHDPYKKPFFVVVCNQNSKYIKTFQICIYLIKQICSYKFI